jgi:AcrR family transcriptional regulator
MPKSQPSDKNDAGKSAVKAARTQWRTRQVLEAATKLMEDQGFHAMSMQSLAEEAGVSVGLIYQYFGSKEDVLYAVIVDILDAYSKVLPQAIEEAGPDPVDQLAAGFAAYCRVVDSHHHATTLAYREGKTLPAAALDDTKQLELRTVEPLHNVIRAGQDSGVFLPVDAELMTHDLMMLAHSWALKHWHLAPRYTLDEYIDQQLALALRSLLAPETWSEHDVRVNQSSTSSPRKRTSTARKRGSRA